MKVRSRGVQTIAKLVDFEKKQAKLAEKKPVVIKHETPKKKIKVVPDSDEVELKEMSTTDLNRRFNNTFLYLIGKLYTNINMDTFTIAAELLQKEFRVLLSRSPLPIDSKRLVQIMALNMFVIEQTKVILYNNQI